MPVSAFKTPEKYLYNTGFGSYIETEAVEGTIPVAQNTPQRPAYGLYTEKLSGSSFTADRPENQQTWLYRIMPTASHKPYIAEADDSATGLGKKLSFTPSQIRWSPFDLKDDVDWVHGWNLLAGAGDVSARSGMSYFIITAGRSMDSKSAFYSADGHLLIIAQQGTLDIKTELGHLLVRPNEICVIPRGIKYNVGLPDGPVRCYAVELHQGNYTLPSLGPLGSFGLANVRDFQIPHAAYDEDTSSTYQIFARFNTNIYIAEQDHSPFDIVAWHGLYYPYKYDLGRFLTIGSISFDHPDPSIFTLLTSSEGQVEIAIFPPRWIVMEDTFRPPWYHRNVMCEFMGLIQGEYDARPGAGFKPGGASLHNVMAGHGPDSTTHQKASVADLTPQRVGEGSMAFVIESNMVLGLTDYAIDKRQKDYGLSTWGGLRPHFEVPKGVAQKSYLIAERQGVNGVNGVNGRA